MREIGGYLELDDFVQNEYYKDLIALNSARNAFVYLARAKNISKVYLPYYLCDSVSKVCDRENIIYEFYHIDRMFMPIFEKTLQKNEYLYIVNYYGQLTNIQIKKFKELYNNIIIDNVQAFFEEPVEGIDTIYSCRKFFGVPDGAYLFTDAKNIDLSTDSSKDRMKHLLGRYESNCASDYYSDFQANDNMFESLEVMHMSKITKNILGAIDYNKVIEKRNENWKLYHSNLKDINKLDLCVTKAPYMYPFYCENASEIRKRLIAKKIYIPILWPNIFEFDNCDIEKDLANNILPLPCDQRYDKKDIESVISELVNYISL